MAATLKRTTMFPVATTARSYKRSDRSLEVDVYSPFGDGLFIAQDSPARIPSSAILTVIRDDCPSQPSDGMLEVSQKAFDEFVRLSHRTSKCHERLWLACSKRVSLR
jgi:hypothetical protein